MTDEQRTNVATTVHPYADMLNSMVTQLLAHKPIVTYAAVEAVMRTAGFNPFDASDLYLDLLHALDEAHIFVVEQRDALGLISDITDERTDETVVQVRATHDRIHHLVHALLHATDERRLLEIYRDGITATRELRQDLNPKHRMVLERRAAASKTALDELIRHNLRLVAAQAHIFAKQTKHLDVEDLIQEGLIGLHRAIELYRLDFGYRLSTYATYWIRQAIRRAIADQDRMVRLPAHIIESLAALRRATHELTQTLGRAPSDEELAARIGQEVERVRQLQQLQRGHVSLDLPIGPEGTATLGEVLPDPRTVEPETVLIERSQREALHGFLGAASDLSTLERTVIALRYGLGNGERQTLQEIGDGFKLTRKRIHQIERRALKKLKRHAQQSHLMVYLED